MKRFAAMAAIFAILSLWGFVNQSFANVYASLLKFTNPDSTTFDSTFTDGTGIKFWFMLNDTASSVTIKVKEAASGSVIAEIDAGPMGKGQHGVEWDGTGTKEGKQYTFEVTATQQNYSNTEWTIFFDSGDIDIFTRGCDVVRDMSSPLFGLIYTPNNGGPLGKGITIYNPDGSFHDPFLVAKDINDGGTIDWGGGDPMSGGIFDDEERFYVSSIAFGEIRRMNPDYSVTTLISGLTFPKGLHLVGTGENRVLYICDDNKVLRAKIGNEETFTDTLEVVGEFSNAFPRDVSLDDDGFMYVIFRTDNDLGSEGAGINKYDISGNLPVKDNDAVWFLGADVTHIPVELQFDYGQDRTTADDDILYYSTRAGDTSLDDGVWRVDDIHSIFPNVVPVVTEDKIYHGDQYANINARAAIALDAAGNIILMENSNEHVFFFAPPGDGPTNSFTTTSPETLFVRSVTAVEETGEENLPIAYRLNPNFPNPFNPSTTITYTLAKSGFTTVKIFNPLGVEVRTLVNQMQSAGLHRIQWDGKNDAGKNVSAGVYLLTIKSGNFRHSLRMTLAK